MLLSAAIALLALGGQPGGDTPALTAVEEAGRRLFEEGTRADGTEVLARLDADAGTVPASVLPCAGCHGPDGRGRPEGAVVPPSLLWSDLVKPYGHVDGLRTHPPFDERRFALAVQEGVDPAGNRLDAAMPRYSLSRADLEGLVAWLRRLERRLEPGLGETTIRLGTVLPAEGPARQAGLAMRGVLEASFAEVNAAGGVNGRKLSLVPAEATGGPEGVSEAVRRLAEQERVFALVSGLTPGGEQALAAAAEQAGLPLVGPFTQRPSGAGLLVFNLTSGVEEQVRLLIDFAAKDLGPAGRPPVLLRPAGQDPGGAAAAARRQAAARGWRDLAELEVPVSGLEAAAVKRLVQAGTATLLHLGDDAALARLLRAAAEAGWAPVVLVPGALAGRAAVEAPPGFGGRVFLAYPSAPGGYATDGLRRLERLAGPGGTARHRALLASAAAASDVAVEGLRRAGRQLSRAALVRGLEGLQDFETGLVPPLSFGPGRHIGALGGYVVAAEPGRRTLEPVGGWRRLE